MNFDGKYAMEAHQSELRQPDIAVQLIASQCRDPNIDHMVNCYPNVDGFIYVVEAPGHGVCKVGSASFMPLRLSDLQIACWVDLRCAAGIAVISENPLRLEFAAHRILKADGRHIRGEWFAVEPQQAAEAVVLAAKESGIRIASVGELFAATCEENRQRGINAEAERRALLRRKLGME